MSRICNMCYSAQNNTIEMEVYGPKFPNHYSASGFKPYIKFDFHELISAQAGITIDYNDGSDPVTVYPRTDTATDIYIGDPALNSIFTGVHTYIDNKSGWRVISLTVHGGLNTIKGINIYVIAMRGSLPIGITNCSKLESLLMDSVNGYSLERHNVSDWDYKQNGIEAMPPEFLKLKTLKSFNSHFSFKYDSDLNKSIPIEIMDSNLEALRYGGGTNETYFADKTINNFDKLPLLKSTLEKFTSDHSGLTPESIPSNWNENTNLKYIHLHGFRHAKNVEDLLVDGVTSRMFLQSYGTGDTENGNKWCNLINNPQLNYLQMIGRLNDSTVPIENLDNAILLKTLSMSGSTAQIALLSTQEEVEQFFNWWYTETERIASKDQSTVPYSPEGVLRDMTIGIGGPALTLNFTAPQDFVVGVSNGTIDPNNKLGNIFYVLKYQYNQNVSYTSA